MVEWKKLGEIAEIGTGSNNREDACENGCYPFYVRSKDVLRIDSYLYDEEAILIPGEGGIGDIFHYVNGKYGLHQRTYRVHPVTDEVKGRFIYYYLFANFKTYINTKSYKSTAASIRKPMLLDFRIPIPSLSEQTRIVGILDTFTSAIDNLKEQIAQRRKQYEYYRDQLLDLEGKPGVKKALLKDVCEVINGRAYSQPELLNEGKYRVLRVGNFFSNDSWYYSDLELESKYYCQKGDLLYAWSASFGPHIWEEEKVIYHYHIWKMDCSNGLHKNFMYYWLQSEDMKRQAFTNLHGATMAHLTKALIETLSVPLPPLSDQQRIVSILDTFEGSIQNLEAQLKEREKQYEYYRNKLLTFE